MMEQEVLIRKKQRQEIKYSDVLKMALMLKEGDINKLVRNLQGRGDSHLKEAVIVEATEPTRLQKLLLTGPIWTDKQYKEVLEAREHFNRFRT